MAAVMLPIAELPCPQVDMQPGSPHLDNSVELLGAWGDLRLVYGVMRFLPVKEQLRMIFYTNHGFSSNVRHQDDDSECWANLCVSLCDERQLYLPSVRERTLLASGQGGWKTLFNELWPLRNRFTGSEVVAAAGADRLRLATFCRFRPPTGAPRPTNEDSRSKGVALPLHQRLALLRRSRPELSAKETMVMVMAKGNGSQDSAGGEDNFSQPAKSDGFSASILSSQPGLQGSVLTVTPGSGLRSFDFDAVFSASAAQREVYDTCGLRLVTDLMNGVNGALVLYGQTSSGKTHTMFGPTPDVNGAVEEDQVGIALRVADSVLAAMEERRQLGVQGQLFVSYVEVFGNDVCNLLDDKAEITRSRGVGDVVGHRRVLDGDLARPVASCQELNECLEKGDARKRKANTMMNERSTRAHTLLVLRLEQRRVGAPADEKPVTSALFLADLGGSERVSKSGANADIKAPGGFVTDGKEVARVSWEEYYKCKERVTETNYINNGLLSLKRCISALSERQLRLAAGRKTVPIPFRESKLTAILEPALGGLARTSIIICCSSDESNAEESVQSLRFGEMCSRIEHVQRAASDPTNEVAKALRTMDIEIGEVEAQIRSKERWEWIQTVRKEVVDANDEDTTKLQSNEVTELGGFGAVEFKPASADEVDLQEFEHKVWGQQLVGAEEENARLEFLLEQRRKLLGEV